VLGSFLCIGIYFESILRGENDEMTLVRKLCGEEKPVCKLCGEEKPVLRGKMRY
jgi:hypothetical protein